MTADERIERLLNRFGQTISNLPKPDESKKHYTYRLRTKQNLDKAAKKWDRSDNSFSWDVVCDYACHLCDVIDKLEIALETASRWMPCYLCKNASECSKKGMEDLHCVRPCDEKTINDYMLHDQ